MHTASSVVYLEVTVIASPEREGWTMSGAEWVWLVAAIVGLIAVLGVLELLTVAIASLGDPGETVGPPDGRAL